jgi:galactokinase/mevalonate kinase-like predicted kinase
MHDLHDELTERKHSGLVPRIKAYNRIDGPGSSLDLREFQEAFWRLPEGEAPYDDDAFAAWSRGLPRTVGITIDVGCVVEAHPAAPGQIEVVSRDYGVEWSLPAANVPYRKEYWLLRILDAFGLSGVRFELHNLVPGTKSSGLGGSATATTATCLLANELAGASFTGEQIVGLASLVEQDLGVSITGTQEQSNVVYGGVTDYVWFPWGVPGAGGGYGTSVRRVLMEETDYPELAKRLRVYHSGKERASTDVNSVWRDRLSQPDGYRLHSRKLDLSHRFREGIRKRDWDQVASSIKEYAQVRVALCAEYMTGECWDIQGQCEKHGAQSFPLGAGGGGAVFIFCPSPEQILALDAALSPVYRRIGVNLRARGHEFENVQGALRVSHRPL